MFIPCEKFPSVQAWASQLFRVWAIVSSMVERSSGKSEAVAFNIFLGSPFKQCVTWWKALLRQEAAYPPPSFAAKLKSELAKVCPGWPSVERCIVKDQHLLSVFSDFERHRPWFCSCKTTNQNKEKTKTHGIACPIRKESSRKTFSSSSIFSFFFWEGCHHTHTGHDATWRTGPSSEVAALQPLWPLRASRPSVRKSSALHLINHVSVPISLLQAVQRQPTAAQGASPSSPCWLPQKKKEILERWGMYKCELLQIRENGKKKCYLDKWLCTQREGDKVIEILSL